MWEYEIIFISERFLVDVKTKLDNYGKKGWEIMIMNISYNDIIRKHIYEGLAKRKIVIV